TGFTKPVAGYNDANYLDKIIEDLRGRLNVDRSRMYGVGFSEGGMMLNNYHARNPGLLAGIATICGSMNGTEPLPIDGLGRSVPPSALVLWSEQDEFLPPTGGRGLVTSLVRRVDESKPMLQAPFWNRINGAGQGITHDFNDFTQTDWTGADGVSQVRQIMVKN